MRDASARCVTHRAALPCQADDNERASRTQRTSKELNMIQSTFISTPTSRPVTRATGATTLALYASLLGCSGESVNMGENGVEPSPLPSSSLCLASTTIDGDVIVRSQEEVD